MMSMSSRPTILAHRMISLLRKKIQQQFKSRFHVQKGKLKHHSQTYAFNEWYNRCQISWPSLSPGEGPDKKGLTCNTDEGIWRAVESDPYPFEYPQCCKISGRKSKTNVISFSM